MNLAQLYSSQEGSQLYQLLQDKLSHNFTEPYGYPDVPEFRIVKIYIHGSLTKMNILCPFSKVNSRLRLVIATTVFGMGTDCTDI